MKKLISLVLISLVFSFNAIAQEQWKEGKHYKIIAKEVTEKKEVMEFFSFWCPACYRFEPVVDQMKVAIPKSVQFKKVHVNFMGSAPQSNQDDATRAMLVARSQNKEPEMVKALFNRIHPQRKRDTNLNDMKTMLSTQGLDAQKFEKLAKGFGINNLFNRNNGLVKKYADKIEGVPNFIINGKYQPIFNRNMKPDEMIALVVWLTNQK